MSTGAPFTLAAYVIEGASSKNYTTIKTMAFNNPDVLHALLESFCDSIITYCDYQVKNGAQVLQVFDSWAAQLAPDDFEVKLKRILCQYFFLIKIIHGFAISIDVPCVKALVLSKSFVHICSWKFNPFRILRFDTRAE